MANENTDNLSDINTSELNSFNIDSPANDMPNKADDFFEALDRKVNQGILERLRCKVNKYLKPQK